MKKEQNTDDFFPKSMVDKYLENKSKKEKTIYILNVAMERTKHRQKWSKN